MELMRGWILSVTVSAIVIAAAEALMPAGTVKQVGRLTGGLILMLGVVQPLVQLDYDDLYALVMALPAGAIRQERLEESQYGPLKASIEEELGAYIEDKGKQLGAACTARVTCTQAEGGVPVPSQVTVVGPLTPGQQQALSQWLSQELGIPRQGQIYRREDVP